MTASTPCSLRLGRAARRWLSTLLLIAGAVTSEAAERFDHDATVALFPAEARLQVVDQIDVSGRRRYAFALAPGLKIEALTLDGKPLSASAAVDLPTDARRLTVTLAGRLAPLPTQNASPLGPRQPVIAPNASYLPWGWLPWPDGERMSYRVQVQLPQPGRAVVEGDLQREQIEGDRYRAVFTSSTPRFAPALFAGPYEVKERHHGTVRLRTYFYPEAQPLAEEYLTAAARYLSRYSEQIGPYPFGEFHIIAAEAPVGLGFRGLTYISRQILPFPYMKGRSLAHEVLHNWWGNGVLVDYRDGNWSEGLTTYLADYALAEAESPQAARSMRLNWLRDYAALPPERERALAAFTARYHGAASIIGYDKGAFLFHMLRQRLGDETFQRGLQRFWQQQRDQIANWDDLQRAFEAVSGEALTPFFEQWLTRTGAPLLQLTNAEVHPQDDAYALSFTLTQSSPHYQLEVPVLITMGSEQIHHRLSLSSGRHRAQLTLPERPTRLIVDPDYDLFRQLHPQEKPPLLRDLTLASEAALVLYSDVASQPLQATAQRLAQRLLEGEIRPLPPQREAVAEASALLAVAIGQRQGERLLQQLGEALPPPVSDTADASARVWASQGPQGQRRLIILADDVAALEALLRPLPHYGRYSYLRFQQSRALDRGVWEASKSPLMRDL